jgi:hypothetical protein
MRFMVFVIPEPKAYLAGQMPSNELIAKMTEYNQQLVNAGIILGGDGLAPPSQGARIEYPAGKGTVTDGPFAEAKEVVGGYWIWQTKSKEEAIEWARRAPMQPGDVVEVRRIFEMEDFAPSPEVDRAYEVLKGKM